MRVTTPQNFQLQKFDAYFIIVATAKQGNKLYTHDNYN